AHNFYLPDGSIGFDEAGDKVWRLRPRAVRYERIRVNHYYTKSRAEWEGRRGAKIASGGAISERFLDRAFRKVHADQVEDVSASAFAPALEARMRDHVVSELRGRIA
ncbi:MAG: hypothetical protein AAFU55_08440, partial [Pseudomonadota bacterium]